MSDQLFTLKEAGEILRVSERTLRNWNRDARIAFVRLPSGNPRITMRELQRIIDPLPAGEPSHIDTDVEEQCGRLNRRGL